MQFARVTLVLAGTALYLSAAAGPQPNVLFIVVDDLNTALGCYGHPVVKTPNIDRLAARGVRFDRAYCQYPLCNPSRTSWLTGRRPDATRVMDNATPPRSTLKDAVLLPEHFRKNGYFTARVGKFAHNRFEEAIRWDISEDAGGVPRQPVPAPRPQPRQDVATEALRFRATEGSDADEPDGKTARRVVQILEQKRDTPFFVGVGFARPHPPFIAPRR